MRRILLVVAISLLASTASAQKWAKEMFEATSHDFGTVAANSKTEFRFTFNNPYRDPIHITGVRTSCGCTTPTVVKNDVKFDEQGEILAHFNTDRFTGKRGATLTVTIDKPQYAEVQLRIDGVIRTDISINPGVVNFGSVDRGALVERTVTVDYHGSSAWKINEVRVNSPYLDAKLVEGDKKSRQSQLQVSLKPDAPVGYLRDEITLLTSDPGTPQIGLMVEGRVVAELTANPANLILGAVPMGQKVTKQFVLQAKKPFKITKIACDDPSLQTTVSDEAKTWQMVAITFVANEAGQIDRKLHVETDLGQGASIDVPVHVEVVGLAKK
ncbi:MAG: DUF1573 domain-containing protein [Planctomycetes bacterium]|nr:DUF1573 domain-containing protein [Planctomycetota bacterium]